MASSTVDEKLVLIQECSLRHCCTKTTSHSENEQTLYPNKGNASSCTQNDENLDKDNEEESPNNLTATDVLQSGHGGFLLISFVLILYYGMLVYETLKQQQQTKNKKQLSPQPIIPQLSATSRITSSASSLSSTSRKSCAEDGASKKIKKNTPLPAVGRAGTYFSMLLKRVEARPEASPSVPPLHDDTSCSDSDTATDPLASGGPSRSKIGGFDRSRIVWDDDSQDQPVEFEGNQHR